MQSANVYSRFYGYGWFLLIAVCFIQLLAIYPYQLDDSYITYRYAQNVLDEGIFSFNKDEANVEGFSSPIWLFFSVLTGLFFGRENIHLTGILWGSLSYLLLVSLPLFSKATQYQRYFSSCLLALTPTLLLYAGTGLETVLFAALIGMFAYALTNKLSMGWGIVAVILAPWVRPEAPWLMVMLSLAFLLAIDKKLYFKSAFIYACAFALSIGLLLIIRFVLFKDILPNTFYEKSSSLLAGGQYFIAAIKTPWFLALLAMGAFSVFAKNAAQRTLFVLALSWLLVAVLEGGDWMPNFRFMAPALVLLVLSIDVHYCFAGKKKLIFIALLIVFGLSSISTIPQSISNANNHEVMVTVEDKWVVEWIKRNPFNTVAMLDIGLIGYHIPQNIVDLGGLTDGYISRLQGLHMEKTIPYAYIKERNPDVVIIRLSEKPESATLNTSIILSPVEANLVGDAAFQSGYRPLFIVAPNYPRYPFYALMIFARNDLARTPELIPHQLVVENGVPFVYLEYPKHLFKAH